MKIMHIGYVEACSYANSGYNYAKDALAVTILTLSEIKRSPEAFQKACIIALSAIRAFNFHFDTHYFPHFISVLDAAPAFDFYGFCRLPRYFLHPYYAERLDEYDILNQLEAILCNSWQLGFPDQNGCRRDPKVCQFVKDQLTACFEQMSDHQIDFRTEEEVKLILQRWFEKTLENHPQESFDPQLIDLNDLKIRLTSISWLEKSVIYSFMAADLLCIPDFLQMWELVDLAPYAHTLGRVPFFSWISQQVLGDLVWKALGVGFLLQFINAVQALRQENLSVNEVQEAKWIMVASAAECLYCLSNLLSKNQQLINCLALVAKSLGLIAFFSAAKSTFFTKGKDAFVVQ